MNTIEELYEEWLSLQPLKEEDQIRLNQKFMLDFNYNSNHIEGNTLTYGQTELFLIFGKTIGNANWRDYEEMKAHNVGLDIMMREAADKERPLSEAFIRNLNQIILVENFWKNAETSTGEKVRMQVQIGAYKTRPNSVRTSSGEIFEYVSPQETPAFMTDLVNWYNQEEQKSELSPIKLASLLHYRYIRIHPFEDGNGRIARLLVNYVLHRHNYPMIVIQSDKEHRDEYINILNQCDVSSGLIPSDGVSATLEQIQPFVVYLEVQLQRALKMSIKAAKGENIEEDGDRDKKIELLKRKIDKDAKVKSPQIVYEIFQDVNRRIWDKAKYELNKYDVFFEEKRETHEVNNMKEKYDKKVVSTLPFDSITTLVNKMTYKKTVSDAPPVKKIFGYDTYEADIYSVEWQYQYYGIKNSDLDLGRDFKVTLKLYFNTDVYELAFNLEYSTVYTVKLPYNELMLDSDVNNVCCSLSEGIYKFVENKLREK